MIRPIYYLAVLIVSSAALSASAQDFTTQDPRYTTTPSQYTTTPAQYTTTPAQYTTTPAAYIPQVGVLPITNVPTPTIPGNLPNTTSGLPLTNPLNSSNINTTNVNGSNVNTANLQVPTTTQTQQAQLVQVIDPQEEAPIVPLPLSDVTNETEPLVEQFARLVLQLDDEETLQFVSDYFDFVAQLGLEPSELSWSIRFKIVLYLTLGRLLESPV